MNIQTEVNKLRSMFEALAKEVEGFRYQADRIEAKLGEKPNPRYKVELLPVQVEKPTPSEISNLNFTLKLYHADIQSLKSQLDRIESHLPKTPPLGRVNAQTKKKNNKVIYSAMFGDYDQWVEPEYVNEGWDHILFTDQPISSDRYQVVKLEHTDKLERKIKIVPHLFKQLKDYDIWAWMDAGIKPNTNLDELVLGEFTILRHPSHNCTYQEANACLSARKDHKEVIESLIKRYKGEGFPTQNGMVATGFHVKKNTPLVREFCDQWWIEVLGGSRRDQLSFNYVLWKFLQKYPDFVVKYLPFNYLHQKFDFRVHKKGSRKYYK